MSKCLGQYDNGRGYCEKRDECPLAEACRQKYNETAGKCDCKYKRFCHTPRQFAISTSGTKPQECMFYQMIVEREAARTADLTDKEGPE